jgi:hypothetical protein
MRLIRISWLGRLQSVKTAFRTYTYWLKDAKAGGNLRRFPKRYFVGTENKTSRL